MALLHSGQAAFVLMTRVRSTVFNPQNGSEVVHAEVAAFFKK